MLLDGLLYFLYLISFLYNFVSTMYIRVDFSLSSGKSTSYTGPRNKFLTQVVNKLTEVENLSIEANLVYFSFVMIKQFLATTTWF